MQIMVTYAVAAAFLVGLCGPAHAGSARTSQAFVQSGVIVDPHTFFTAATTEHDAGTVQVVPDSVESRGLYAQACVLAQSDRNLV